jgi:hypothetical protein
MGVIVRAVGNPWLARLPQHGAGHHNLLSLFGIHVSRLFSHLGSYSIEGVDLVVKISYATKSSVAMAKAFSRVALSKRMCSSIAGR